MTGPPAGRRAHGPMKDKQRLKETVPFSLEARPQVKKYFYRKHRKKERTKRVGSVFGTLQAKKRLNI